MSLKCLKEIFRVKKYIQTHPVKAKGFLDFLTVPLIFDIFFQVKYAVKLVLNLYLLNVHIQF